MITVYKPKDILILKHIYDKNVLNFDLFLNETFVDWNDDAKTQKYFKYLKINASYYVWDWMDNV